ncbi:hypothetical protein [Nocardioides sp. TF02-7]|uniref:hypothetical protein n=1 Tax=Nocardioides sp. TF02-7 TaxID=2917724 RepID=UPI001F06923B|nr:hypothetical protein [Nocardioides sp. TF02-7]UMG93528.1 hypothetical protein MF408_04790 [Nocardioides sp. TF02-7]
MDTLEHDLTERLRRIGDDLDLPTAPPSADVRRGRRRLRRHRGTVVAGSALAVSGVAGGLGLAGPIAAGPAEPPAERVADDAAVAAPVPGDRSRAAPDREQLLSEMTQQAPGGAGTEVSIGELEAAAAAAEAVAGDQPWFRIAMGSGGSWQESGATGCASGWTCEDVTVEGAARARSAVTDGTTQVVAEFDGGVVVLTVGHVEGAEPGSLAFEGGDEQGFLIAAN